jgi:mannan endo-1,6-alpha-mannosidase
MCALEIVQGLLLDDAPAPLKGDDIKVIRSTDWAAMDVHESKIKSTPSASDTAETASATSDAPPKPTKSEDAAGSYRADLVLASFSIVTVLTFLGLA